MRSFLMSVYLVFSVTCTIPINCPAWSLPDHAALIFGIYSISGLAGCPLSAGPYQVMLLCPEDGRQRVVEVAVCMCEAVLGGKEALEQVCTDMLTPRMTGKQSWLFTSAQFLWYSVVTEAIIS